MAVADDVGPGLTAGQRGGVAAEGGAASATYASDRRGYGVPVPGVFVIPEPNAYRPYIPGATAEESALAQLELGLKMYDMASAGQPAAPSGDTGGSVDVTA